MSFFRSAALRRIVYALVLALALMRLATHAHSDELSGEIRTVGHAIMHLAE
jgi:hypothetical protein